MAKIADRIRERRKALGLSLAALAEAVGVSAQAVSNWENRPGSAPGRKHLARVAKVLNIELDRLIGEIDEYSKDEGELLAQYRRLSTDEQSFIRRLILGLIKTRR